MQLMNILFIGKKGDRNAEWAGEYLKQILPDTITLYGIRNDMFPEEIIWWEGDYILSYLSPWIIPKALLERARKGAINWHPGPPEYPGIGCTNFAVYNQEKEFGITCHYMANQVDSGKIIETRKFPILSGDTVYSITQKCYAYILCSFLSICDKIAQEAPLPSSNFNWKRIPYTRKELNDLCKIEPSMPKEEINKRIQATTYNTAWAYTEINGIKFYLK